MPPASPLSKLCFLFQTKLNPAPSSLQKHSAGAAMGSLQPRRCSHMFMGVEIWKELNPLVRQGYRRACVHGEKQTPRFNENHLKGERCKGESPKRSAPARGRGTGRGGGPRGDTVGCGQKGLLVTEPFSSACEMLVVTELRPTKRSFYSTRWRGEKKITKNQQTILLKSKYSF